MDLYVLEDFFLQMGVRCRVKASNHTYPYRKEKNYSRVDLIDKCVEADVHSK